MSVFNNVPVPEELRALHATVVVAFDKAKSAAEADIRSIYETKKRKTALDLVKVTSGKTARMVHVIPTMTARPGITQDGAMPVFTPGAASVSSKALPQGYIIEIHYSDLRDDIWGILNAGIEGAAEEAVNWKYTTVALQMLDGLTTNTVDGLSFFNTAHYVNLRDDKNGFFSNKLSLPLTADNFAAARTAFRRIPRENGLPRYDNNPDVLVVSAKNETLAEQIVAVSRQFGGADNVNKDKAEIVVLPEWDLLPKPGGGTYEDAWMLLKTTSTLRRPMEFNEREPLNISYIGAKQTETPGLTHRWMVYGEMVLAFPEPRLALYSAP